MHTGVRTIMDNEYQLDYDAILKTVREAEVVAFRFVTVPMRLLVDNRFTEVDPPLVAGLQPGSGTRMVARQVSEGSLSECGAWCFPRRRHVRAMQR